MIFTSYYGNVKNILSDGFDRGQLIRISLCPCNGFRDLASEEKFFVNRNDFIDYKNNIISWKEYCLKYYNHLYDLEWVFYQYQLLKKYNNKVLLCFEKDYHQCHRGLLIKFLNWWYGYKVIEEYR